MLLTIEGTTQPIGEWSADYGIPVTTIRMRLQRGWSEERAVTTPTPVHRGYSIPVHGEYLNIYKDADSLYSARLTLNGKTHSIAEWSKIIGISEIGLRQRLRYGWPLERALTEPVGTSRGSKGKPITFNGETRTTEAWARHLGITSSAIRARLAKGWPLERALSPALKRGTGGG